MEFSATELATFKLDADATVRLGSRTARQGASCRRQTHRAGDLDLDHLGHQPALMHAGIEEPKGSISSY